MSGGRRDLKPLLALAARFGLAGLVTTTLSFIVIASLDVGLHVRPAVANAAGYAVGVPVGFLLNRRFVFAHQGAAGAAALRFATVIAGAWLLNQAVLAGAGRLLGAGAVQHLAAQLCGMATYTVTTFIAYRLWVFRPART